MVNSGKSYSESELRGFAELRFEEVCRDYSPPPLRLGFKKGPSSGWTIPGKGKVYIDLSKTSPSRYISLFDSNYKGVITLGDMAFWDIADTLRHETDHNSTKNGAACPGDAKTQALVNREILLAGREMGVSLNGAVIGRLANIYADLVIDSHAMAKADQYGAASALSRRELYKEKISESNDFFYAVLNRFSDGFMGVDGDPELVDRAAEIISSSNRSNYAEKAGEFAKFWLENFPPPAPGAVQICLHGEGEDSATPFDGDMENDSGIPIAVDLTPEEYDALRDSLGLSGDETKVKVEWYRARLPRLLAKNDRVRRGLYIPVGGKKSQKEFDVDETLKSAPFVWRRGKLSPKVLNFRKRREIRIEGALAEEVLRPYHIVLDGSGSMGNHGNDRDGEMSRVSLAVLSAMGASRLENEGVKATVFGRNSVSTKGYYRSLAKIDRFLVDSIGRIVRGDTILPAGDMVEIKPGTATFLITDGSIKDLEKARGAMEHASMGENYLALFLIKPDDDSFPIKFGDDKRGKETQEERLKRLKKKFGEIPADDIILVDEVDTLPGLVIDFAKRNSKVKKHGR